MNNAVQHSVHVGIQHLVLVLVTIVLSACAVAGNSLPPPQKTMQVPQRIMTVFRSPTCGCCSDWVTYVQANGFTVQTENVQDITTIKARYNIPMALQSCHTALIDGYIIEGHVPIAEIERLLRERPDVVGLAVPGMPVGSPGMEVAGATAEPYDVMTFDETGTIEIFASYPESL